MKAKIINLDAEEVDLVLVDTEIKVRGQRLFFESSGDLAQDKIAQSCVIDMANKSRDDHGLPHLPLG